MSDLGKKKEKEKDNPFSFFNYMQSHEGEPAKKAAPPQQPAPPPSSSSASLKLPPFPLVDDDDDDDDLESSDDGMNYFSLIKWVFLT